MENKAEVIILGAGIVGCSIAFALAKRGIKTLNVDTLPAAGYGSTSFSSAVIRPIYSHITSCAIAHESRAYWQQWREFIDAPDERGYAQYNECGGIVLVKDDDLSPYQGNLDAMDAVGVKYQHLNHSELTKLFPGIDLHTYGPPKLEEDESFGQKSGGKITSAILVDAAGYVSDPQLACHNLQMAAMKLGAKFLFNEKVVEITKVDNTVIGMKTTNGLNLQGGCFVNAAGPHSSVINQLAGLDVRIRTRAERHEVVYLKAPLKHFSKTEKFIVDQDTGIYVRSDGEDILVGSADPECDLADVVDPDNYNSSFTNQWTLQSYRAAQRFPEIGISNSARGVVGLYDVSKDWIPIYDRSELDGYYLAIGTSGNQFKNAPLIGEVMAQVIEAGEQHDENPASLYLQSLNRDVSLDFYSRNREIQETNSVMA